MSYEYNADLDKQELNKILDVVYPVGSIYMSVNSANPGTIFAGTTWTQIEGRFLVGKGTSTSNTSASDRLVIGENDTTGGYTAPQNSKHSHSVDLTSGTPSNNTSGAGSQHRHGPSTDNEYYLYVDEAHTNARVAINNSGTRYVAAFGSSGHFHSRGQTAYESAHTHSLSNHKHSVSGNTGEVSAVSAGNLPPWFAVYMWKRIA